MADSKKRVTASNARGRKGENKGFSRLHNDRNFDASNDNHIDTERSKNNWYWHCYQNIDNNMTFDQCERKFYEEHFAKSLNAKNERYKKEGHQDKCQTIEQYLSNKQSCPEATIYQVGCKENTIDKDILQSLVIEQLNWEIKQYKNVKILDAALHIDENGVPHVHTRKVWIGHDKEGNECVGQNKALKEMGIEAPRSDKYKGRYNNAKQTYTKQCREHFIELCQKRGIDLELIPRERSKSGLALEEYQARQEEKKAERARQELEKAKQELAQVGELLTAKQEEINECEQNLKEAKKKFAEIWVDIFDAQKKYDSAIAGRDQALIDEKTARDNEKKAKNEQAEAETALKQALKQAEDDLTAKKAELDKEFEDVKQARDKVFTDLEKAKQSLAAIQGNEKLVKGRLAISKVAIIEPDDLKTLDSVGLRGIMPVLGSLTQEVVQQTQAMYPNAHIIGLGRVGQPNPNIKIDKDRWLDYKTPQINASEKGKITYIT